MVQKIEIIFILHLILNKLKGICDKSELVGTWKVVFEGTNYPDLEFKVIDKILHGKYDNRYDNVC